MFFFDEDDSNVSVFSIVLVMGVDYAPGWLLFFRMFMQNLRISISFSKILYCGLIFSFFHRLIFLYLINSSLMINLRVPYIAIKGRFLSSTSRNNFLLLSPKYSAVSMTVRKSLSAKDGLLIVFSSFFAFGSNIYHSKTHK